MIRFPENLVPLIDSFSISVRPAIIRSEFESGPDRQASSSCGQYTDYSLVYSVCGCDGLKGFSDWFRIDLVNGSKSFIWFNPCDKIDMVARISDGTYGANPDTNNLDSFNISLNIEVWVPNA